MPTMSQTTPTGIDSINHVGLAVFDMADAASRYERLGFVLSPLSMHAGAMTPGEAPRPLGSGNRCAVFGRNYVEILAHVRKELPDVHVREFLERYQGLHIICFGAPDADVLETGLARAGVGNSGVIPLQRDVDTEDGERTAKFRRVLFEDGQTPEGLIQAAQHLTPQYIHQDRYRRHPNGAVALTEVVLCVPDDETAGFVDRYRRYTGVSGEPDGVSYVVRLPLGRVRITPASAVQTELPGETPPAVPSLVAHAVAVRDLPATRALLDRNQVPVRDAGDRLLVPSAAACGGAVIFEQVSDGGEGAG